MGVVKKGIHSVTKGLGKLVGIDMSAATKAAKAQANATNAATQQAVQSANYQAEAAANQIKATQDQNAARQAANDLLSRPVETANVDLNTDSTTDDAGDDLLGRKRTRRAAYRDTSNSGLNV